MGSQSPRGEVFAVIGGLGQLVGQGLQRQMALLQKQMDTHQRAIADTVLHIANVLERLELIADEADEEVYEEPPRRPPARPAPPPAKPLRRGPR